MLWCVTLSLVKSEIATPTKYKSYRLSITLLEHVGIRLRKYGDEVVEYVPGETTAAVTSIFFLGTNL
ncbi:hypothetical protein Hanom_Chr16g01508081 [Helianthus anomalus]